jgi:hypothetical protein
MIPEVPAEAKVVVIGGAVAEASVTLASDSPA